MVTKDHGDETLSSDDERLPVSPLNPPVLVKISIDDLCLTI